MTEALKQARARRSISILALTLLTNMVILWGHQRLLVFAVGFILMCLLPGYLLVHVLLSGRVSLGWLEVAVLTCGLGFATLILGTLGLHYLPGSLRPAHLLALYDAVMILLVGILFFRDSVRALVVDHPMGSRHLVLLVLMLGAAFFRLANLGYSEFQGDEARAMLMAAGAIRGEDGILFLHRKGPAEILIPTAFYALSGTTNELVARLPFALANIGGLLGTYLLARCLFPARGVAAAATLGVVAVDGYLIAFGRIVQYQSIVILMMVLTAWCAYAWFQGRASGLLLLAALFLGIGTLAHYEAVFVTPFVAWLFVTRARRDGWAVSRWVREGIGPALILLATVGLFYAPFILHPHFRRTVQYLTEERIGQSLLYNNLGDFFWRATFYSSTYYIVFLILGAMALVIREVHRTLRPAPLGLAVSAISVIALGIVALRPDVPVVANIDLAFLPFVVVLVVAVASSRTSTEVKAVLLWFGLASLFLFFMTRKPKNHGYLLSPAWAILVGAALNGGWEQLKSRTQRFLEGNHLQQAALVVGALLMAVFGYYEYVVFVRHRPNFLLAYPQARPSFYLSIHGDELPRVGFFGFPHRSGLKAAGALRAGGVLQGSYRANAEPLITSWYTRKMAWCPGSADYYLITNPIQDSEPLPTETIREEQGLLARVWSDGEAISEIYSRRPVEASAKYELADLEPSFDASTEADTWLWALRSPVPQWQVDANLGGMAQMLGYDAPHQVTAGETLPLMLYWRSLAPIDHHYNVFVHVEVPGEHIWAQSDGTPGCGSEPTTEWEPPATIVDGHSLALDPSTPPGEYPLLVGLYGPMTGERLPVTGRNASASGNAVTLGSVEVIAPSSAHTSEEDQL